MYPHLPVALSMRCLPRVGRTIAWVQRSAHPLAPRRVYGPHPEPDPMWKYSEAELGEAARALTSTSAAVLAGDEEARREWGQRGSHAVVSPRDEQVARPR